MHRSFEVIKTVLLTTYRLKLVKNWFIYPTFPLSLLKPYQKSTNLNRLLPDLDKVLADTDLLDGEDSQKIKEIKDS
jgi:hypothetical protein